jgi:hypothetical protein
MLMLLMLLLLLLLLMLMLLLLLLLLLLMLCSLVATGGATMSAHTGSYAATAGGCSEVCQPVRIRGRRSLRCIGWARCRLDSPVGNSWCLPRTP